MNTRIKHTPGPWEETYDTGDNTWGVCLPEGGDILAQLIENEANARLMAAALAMYEALLSILPATDIVSGQETDNCRWCGRDYTDHAVETGETLELCSSDDCPGYIARAALAQAERGTLCKHYGG